MSLRYGVYARKSQEDQGRQVQSIDSQLGEIKRSFGHANLAVVEEFTEAKSAWEPDNRPEFARLLKLIERGEIEGILAWHPDRLSRNETDAAAITRLLRQGKLKDLRFASYHFINSPEGIMMLQIALSQSQYQNSKMAVDVRRGMEQKRTAGWFPHRAPEGYVNDLRTHTILPDPERFDLIRKGWDLLLSGRYTVADVIELLNREGYRTLKREKSGGSPLSRSSGYNIFTNPFYTGRFLEKGLLLEGKHQAMVTEDEFELAQTIIGRRGTSLRVKHEGPFNRIIRCKRCGWGATTELQRGRHGRGSYHYIHCSNPKCSRRSIRQDRFEEQIVALLSELRLHPHLLHLLNDEMDSWLETEKSIDESTAESKQVALEDTKKAIARLLDLLLRGVIDEASYQAKRSELETQAHGIRKAQREQETRSDRVRESVRNGLVFAEIARDLFLTGEAWLKRKVVQILGIELTIDDGLIEVKTHPVFDLILRLQREHIEPLKSGSESTKKGPLTDPCYVGWPATLSIETLHELVATKPIEDLTQAEGLPTQFVSQ